MFDKLAIKIVSRKTMPPIAEHTKSLMGLEAAKAQVKHNSGAGALASPVERRRYNVSKSTASSGTTVNSPAANRAAKA